VTAVLRRPRGAVLAAALMAVLIAALALPRAASANHRQPTIFDAPRLLRSDDAGLRARTLDDIKSLGATWVRVVLYWHDVAPHAGWRHRPQFAEKDPRAYDWHVYDRIVSEARARGLRVLLTPSSPVPRWATLDHSTTRLPSITHFGRFMRALGRHYRHQVYNWSIWNEPNLKHFLGPQFRRHKAYSPKLYRRLFIAARKALNASGNRHDRVLIGETAPRTRRNRSVAPLAFLRGTLCLNGRYHKRRGCRKLDADGWAHHPYTTGSGPYWVSRKRDDVTIGSLGRLTHALWRAGRAHAINRGAGLWITEFGVQSKPDPYVGVSQQRQAEWRSIGEWLAWRTGRVKAFSQYLMRDDLPRHGHGHARYSGFESGLRRSGGRRKKAYDGFRLALVADRASRRRVTLWGHVRPARHRVRATIRWRGGYRGRWHRLKRVRTDHYGTFTARTRYRKGRQYRLDWSRYAGAPTRVTTR
jgi:hypothetical protein